jgi:hypothetical protein
MTTEGEGDMKKGKRERGICERIKEEKALEEKVI